MNYLKYIQTEKKQSAKRVMDLFGVMTAYQTMKNPEYDLAIDVGSYDGMHSRVYSMLFKKVISFDPSGHEDVDTIQSPNQVFHSKALYSDKRVLDMTTYPVGGFDSIDPPARLKNHLDKYQTTLKKVQTYTLDEFNVPAVNFLKIDAEGSDGHIILGAKETIKRFRPVIQVEDLGNKKEAENFLFDNDYELLDGKYLFGVYSVAVDSVYIPIEKK